ncbi:UNKNOWN [Stylonychia lemnae]|uniref:Uncharacterized protein n=1 Tax=Stylonychia lemnae TaxID=5949 RepID=A0A078AI16_STYLE|nr:UNKNOWN [Stylonychia lemnae]|eukprot:CDW81885.1 UNKNOWN [Stylonychia lemnae]
MGSPAKRMIQNVMYLLIMSSFIFDSYYKYYNLSSEADMLRSKYQHLQEYLSRNFNGFQLPIKSEIVSSNSFMIIQVYAIIQGLSAMLVLIGKRQFAWMLILLTSVHLFVVHNPNYKNTTEVDKQRAYKHICGDLCLIATLIMTTGFKRLPKLKLN